MSKQWAENLRHSLGVWAALVLVVLLGAAAWGYTSAWGVALRNRWYAPPPELRPLLQRWQQVQRAYEEEPPALPVIKAREVQDAGNFGVRLADKPLGLRKVRRVLRNPFAAEPYPLAASVIYKNNLVTLFAPGYFACYHLPGLARNRALEQQLNTRRFAYQWVLDGELVALAAGHYLRFRQGRWQPFTSPMPLSRQAKLYEDGRYVACLTCNGEWGGEVYFYDKQQRTYYLASATCPVAVVRRNGQYLVVSSLAHMMGTGDVQQIENPSELTRWLGTTKPQERDFARSHNAPISQGSTLFDYSKLLLRAGFELRNQMLYVVEWRYASFLATWENGEFQVVDPLFNSVIQTADPVTTTYGADQVLVSLNAQDVPETGCLLFTAGQAIAISWHPEATDKPFPTPSSQQAPLDSASPAVVDSAEAQIID